MRPTLTIDEDVALLLRNEIRRSGEPMKQAVNRCLRAALTSRPRPGKAKPFKVTPIDLRLPDGIDMNKTPAILKALEVPFACDGRK